MIRAREATTLAQRYALAKAATIGIGVDLDLNLRMWDVVGGIGIFEPLAQDRHVLLVLTPLTPLEVFGILNGYQSHDAFAVACEHDSLIAERDSVDVLG